MRIVNAALRVLGFAQEDMSAHGFRAMAATLLNESGRFHPDAIERQLAHVERDGVRRAFTRGEYWNERVTMMQFWSDELDRLRNGAKLLKPSFRGNVPAQEDEGQSRRFRSSSR